MKWCKVEWEEGLTKISWITKVHPNTNKDNKQQLPNFKVDHQSNWIRQKGHQLEEFLKMKVFYAQHLLILKYKTQTTKRKFTQLWATYQMLQITITMHHKSIWQSMLTTKLLSACIHINSQISMKSMLTIKNSIKHWIVSMNNIALTNNNNKHNRKLNQICKSF